MRVTDQIKFRGAVYVRVAQLQQLLQQFETEAGGKLPAVMALQKALAEAHKALLNRDDKEKKQALGQLAKIKGAVPELVQQFEQDVTNKVDALVELTNTIAGHVGMGGA